MSSVRIFNLYNGGIHKLRLVFIFLLKLICYIYLFIFWFFLKKLCQDLYYKSNSGNRQQSETRRKLKWITIVVF